MPAHATARAEGFAADLAMRRSQAGFRLGVGALTAVMFGPFLGWGATLGWWTAYAAAQALERHVLNPGCAKPMALATLSLSAWVYGGLAVIAVRVDGVWGLTAGICLLCCSLLNAALGCQRSTAAFVAVASPFAAYLALLTAAIPALGGEPHHAAMIALSDVVVLISVAAIWRSAAAALKAERQARSRAEAADAAKSAFVAMVSHELRTPITAMMAGAQDAGRARTEAARQSSLDLISDSAGMMRTLLNDLLDLSKLEAGKMSVEKATYDLRRLIAEVARFWAPEAQRTGLRLRLEGAHVLPRWVEGDPTRLRQILNNLVSNALKFTEAGAVTLAFRAEPTVEGRWGVEIDVADTGVGLTAEQSARLFTAFQQADDSVARTHGGTGLGLSISRDLARLMGGEISVRSMPGAGSTFTLAVPLDAADAPASEAQDDQPAPAGLRILVADDHAINRSAFSLLLASIGDVICVADGEEAVAMAARRDFDLILLDLNMPRMGGLDAARALRARPGGAPPLVALTAAVSQADVDACFAAGMDGFVAKPVEARALYAEIARVLDPMLADQAEVA